MNKLLFNPYRVSRTKEYYRFLSSGFVHGDLIHLLINMVVFYSFGSLLEETFQFVFPGFGILLFILLYLSSIVVADWPSFQRYKELPHYNSLGASGAVSAVVFASVFIYPLNNISIWGLVDLPGIVLGIIYLAYSFYADKKGGGRINHSAHFAGALYGVVFTAIARPQFIGEFYNEIISVF